MTTPEYDLGRPLCICKDDHNKKCPLKGCCFSCLTCGEMREWKNDRPQPCTHCTPKEA